MNRLGKFWRLTPGALVALAGCAVLVGALGYGLGQRQQAKPPAQDMKQELRKQVASLVMLRVLGGATNTGAPRRCITVPTDDPGALRLLYLADSPTTQTRRRLMLLDAARVTRELVKTQELHFVSRFEFQAEGGLRALVERSLVERHRGADCAALAKALDLAGALKE
jgi:hypothetical protein